MGDGMSGRSFGQGWHPDLNAILDGENGDAREALEQNEAMLEAATRALREKARLFYDVFGVGRGPELLELLREETVDLDLMAVSPVIGAHLREIGVKPSDWAYHRNGQNSVVRYVETMVREARRIEAEESPNV